MAISAGTFIWRAVAWEFPAHTLMVGFGVMCWKVTMWYMTLKDPTIGQTLIQTLFTIALPTMLNWYNLRMSAIQQRLAAGQDKPN